MANKTKKPVMVAFGAIVSERRKLLGISQEILAERVGISQESLSRMECRGHLYTSIYNGFHDVHL